MRYLQLDQDIPSKPRPFWEQASSVAIVCLAFIIASEVMVALDLGDNPWVRLLTLIAALTVVAYLSNHHGRRLGLIAWATTSLYLVYYLSGPDGLFSYTNSVLRSLIVFTVASLFSALSIGRLSGELRRAAVNEATSRRVAENRQRQMELILQRLPVGVLIINRADKRVVYRNEQAEELLGLSLPMTRDGDLLGEDAESEFLPASELSKSEWPLDELIDESEEQRDHEVEYRRPDGRVIQLSISATPVFNAEDEAVATVATLVDISLAKDLEQKKDEFISIASHELKSPVTSLKIYLQLLSKQANVLDREEQLDLIGKANAQVDKLSGLMMDLLDLSRLQSSKANYQFVLRELSPLVIDSVALARDSMPQYIEVDISTTAQAWIDETKLQQVLMNLLSNASKYSEPGSRILVKVESDGNNLYLRVADQGQGIAAEELPKLFELFYQVRSSHSGDGLGIGLYICQQIVSQHGGRLEVVSTAGEGSTFSIVLPLRTEAPN